MGCRSPVEVESSVRRFWEGGERASCAARHRGPGVTTARPQHQAKQGGGWESAPGEGEPTPPAPSQRSTYESGGCCPGRACPVGGWEWRLATTWRCCGSSCGPTWGQGVGEKNERGGRSVTGRAPTGGFRFPSPCCPQQPRPPPAVPTHLNSPTDTAALRAKASGVRALSRAFWPMARRDRNGSAQRRQKGGMRNREGEKEGDETSGPPK